MSTKRTFQHDADGASHQGYHLYKEAYDDENIYLEMDGFQFEASTLPDLTLENGKPRLVVKLPIVWAKKLKLIEPE